MDSVMLDKKAGGGETQQRNPAWNICRANCAYRAGPGMPWTCDYATITGHSRLAACRRLGVSGDVRKCPVKRQREKRAADRLPMTLQRVESARRFREHYNAGMTDREISRRMGVSKSSVHRWREKEGLKPNRR